MIASLLLTVTAVSGVLAAKRTLHRRRPSSYVRLQAAPAPSPHPPEPALERRQDNQALAVTAAHAGGTALLGMVAPSLLFLSAPITVLIMADPLREAWHSAVRERRLTVHTVDAAALVLALAGGYWRLAAFNPLVNVISIRFLHQVRRRSHRRLSQLLVRPPTRAWVLQDDTELEKSVEALTPDDMVLVRPGEVLPVDGTILWGEARLDEHLLTGDARPVARRPGDTVFAGTRLVEGPLRLQPRGGGRQTLAAGISRILEQSTAQEDPQVAEAEKLADEAALPTLLLGAAALPVGGIPGAVGVLWSSVGYTLRFTAPLGTLNYLRHAAGHGMLIKDGQVLDRLARVDTVVLDDSALYSPDEPALYCVHALVGGPEAELLRLAAAAEQGQRHPIAQAILGAARQQGLAVPQPTRSHAWSAHGVAAQVQGRAVYLGSPRYLTAIGIPVGRRARRLLLAAQAAGRSAVLVALDHRLVGVIELQARRCPKAADSIAALKRRGLRVCLLSCHPAMPDRSETLNVHQRFVVTPTRSKDDILRLLKQQGRTVCYVGHSMDDTAAPEQAAVSVSLSGAVTATDPAQVILMDTGLVHLDDLFELGRQFRRNQETGRDLSVVPPLLSTAGVFLLNTDLVVSVAILYGSLVAGVKNAIRPPQLIRRPPPSWSEEDDTPGRHTRSLPLSQAACRPTTRDLAAPGKPRSPDQTGRAAPQ